MNRRSFFQRLVGLPILARCLPLRFQATPQAVEMKLVSTPVVAKARKLKTVWTCETDSWHAYHYADAEKLVVEAVRYFAGVVEPEQQRVQVESL